MGLPVVDQTGGKLVVAFNALEQLMLYSGGGE